MKNEKLFSPQSILTFILSPSFLAKQSCHKPAAFWGFARETRETMKNEK